MGIEKLTNKLIEDISNNKKVKINDKKEVGQLYIDFFYRYIRVNPKPYEKKEQEKFYKTLGSEFVRYMKDTHGA